MCCFSSRPVFKRTNQSHARSWVRERHRTGFLHKHELESGILLFFSAEVLQSTPVESWWFRFAYEICTKCARMKRMYSHYLLAITPLGLLFPCVWTLNHHYYDTIRTHDSYLDTYSAADLKKIWISMTPTILKVRECVVDTHTPTRAKQ